MFKHSKQRDLILDYLKNTKAHPNPERIYADLKPNNPELSLSTVYRNLNMLFSMGLLRKFTVMGETADRYDADISDHYHFYCKKCGNVIDVCPDAVDIKINLPYDADIDYHELFVYGICSSCAKK